MKHITQEDFNELVAQLESSGREVTAWFAMPFFAQDLPTPPGMEPDYKPNTMGAIPLLFLNTSEVCHYHVKTNEDETIFTIIPLAFELNFDLVDGIHPVQDYPWGYRLTHMSSAGVEAAYFFNEDKVPPFNLLDVTTH